MSNRAKILSNTVKCYDNLNEDKHNLACLVLFTVCDSVLSGHAVPSASCGGEAAGDKVTDVATQEGTKSLLVMSGGEGYIDFRMGEFATCDRHLCNQYSRPGDQRDISVCVFR